MIHTMRSGRHHRDGVLWVRNGRHRVVRDRVPLTAIAPTVLRHYGVQAPAHMRTEPLPIHPGRNRDRQGAVLLTTP
jgi:bisphosphoglycerate-independent phosphoglycerate mutase (AlkP superfamily)